MKDEPKGLISVKIQSRSPVKCIDCIYWAKNKEMDDSHYCKCKESPYYLRSTRSGCVYKEWR